MCLGEVLGRITNPGGSKSQPETPQPIDDPRPVVSLPKDESDKPSKKGTGPKKDVRDVAADYDTSKTSMTDTGINY